MPNTNTDPFATMSDEEFDHVSAMDKDELHNHQTIRSSAHIANGGEASFTCPACKGTGRWGYSGRPCFKCKSTGKITKGQQAAHKGSITKATNYSDWLNDPANSPLLEGLKRHLWHSFIGSMHDQVFTERRILSPSQIDAVTDAIARQDNATNARKEALSSARAANSGSSNLNAIHDLFAKAHSKGIARPIFRAENVTVKMARRHEGTLYVTNTNDDYVGKITNGVFHATNQADEHTLSDLRLICDDPKAALMRYTKSTAEYDSTTKELLVSYCGLCGKELTDPVSKARGIGPICIAKWF